MQAWVQKLHASNRSWVPIVDPGIKVDPSYKPYTDGLAADIFVKDAAGKPYLGKVQSRFACKGVQQVLCHGCKHCLPVLSSEQVHYEIM